MTLKEIMKRKREIAQESRNQNLSVEEIRSLNEELDRLNLKELQLEDEEFRGEYEGPITPQGEFNAIGTYGVGQAGQQGNQRSAAGHIENIEQRSAQFESGKTVQFDMDEAELRSLSVSGGNVALQTHGSTQLNPLFNEVSSVVDLVKTIPLPGGEAYKSGFVVSSGSADYTTEGDDYHDNDDLKTEFVQINKAKITTYFEVSEEVQRLGGSHYIMFAKNAARTAVRKKMAEQIMIGTGGANSLQGIFTAPANVIPTSSDLEVSVFDETILDQIVFSHGGDESVEGGAFLILNKQTLAEFSKIRATDGKRLYRIKLDANGNLGTISSEDSFEVPFIINSAVKSFEDAATGDYFLAYGKLGSYEMAMFSGLEIEESRHVKFKSGQIAIKASVLAGGNTASYKGFTRVKKLVI